MKRRKIKVQGWAAFKRDLLRSARGGRAPRDAGAVVVESARTLMRLLTPENRTLLRLIRDEKPESLAALARRSGRAEPNLARTLGKLEAVGLVEFHTEGRRRVPTTRAQRLRIEIDPYGSNDRIALMPAATPRRSGARTGRRASA